jgi:hypothetical protein
MPITVTLIFGVIAVLAAFGYVLVEFAVASRSDNPYGPATSGRVRRARLITGMYVRGGGETTQSVRAFHDDLPYAPRERPHAHRGSDIRIYSDEKLITYRDEELVAN